MRIKIKAKAKVNVSAVHVEPPKQWASKTLIFNYPLQIQPPKRETTTEIMYLGNWFDILPWAIGGCTGGGSWVTHAFFHWRQVGYCCRLQIMMRVLASNMVCRKGKHTFSWQYSSEHKTLSLCPLPSPYLVRISSYWSWWGRICCVGQLFWHKNKDLS